VYSDSEKRAVIIVLHSNTPSPWLRAREEPEGGPPEPHYDLLCHENEEASDDHSLTTSLQSLVILSTSPHSGSVQAFIKCSMSVAILEVMKYLEYRLTGAPAGEIRNFSKFHEMSDRLTGDHMMNCGFAIRESGSS